MFAPLKCKPIYESIYFFRIEHISVEDAEKFVRLVLDQIKPKLFIISTPNHEYNKAFG